MTDGQVILAVVCFIAGYFCKAFLGIRVVAAYSKTSVFTCDDDGAASSELPRDEGLLLLEQYGVFGASPEAWTRRA